MTADREIYTPGYSANSVLAQQLERSGRNNAARTFRVWAREPDAQFAQAWFEAVDWKD